MRFYILLVIIWGWISVSAAQKLTRRAFLGIDPVEKNQVLVINKIYPKTAAEKSGMKVGDELLSINDFQPHTIAELIQGLKKFSPKEKVKLRIRRNNQEITLDARLDEAPKEITPTNRTIYGEVTVNNAVLRSIITVPQKEGKYPAVIFIQGVGCFPVDTPMDTTYGHIQMLRYLGKNNIVTMRVEKSGVGDSQGTPCEKLDFQTELAHFTEALKTLKTYPFVDKDNIFVIGHSLGGVIAPIVAQRENAKGVVVYGTIGQNWTNYLIDSRKAMAIQKGEDYEDVEEWTKNVTDCSVRFFMHKQPIDSAIKYNSDCQDFLKRFSFRSPQYWYQLSEINVAQQWKEYNGYVLSIWGESDKSTFASEHQLITNIINQQNPKKGTFVKIHRADHKMCLRNAQDTDKELDFNPQIAESIYEWIGRVRGGL